MFLGFNPIGFDAIGEAPEERFALAGEADLVLDWQVILYAATHEMISRPSDTPADRAYKGTVQKAFRIDRSIIGSDRIGEQITIAVGEVTLANVEGDYDFLAVDHTAQGQPITIRMGDRTKAMATWRTILKGYMVDHRLDRDAITFRMRDAGYQLDVPASPNVYAGTGGTEGGDDLKGKRKPRVFGHVKEWSPTLVIPASLAYQVNDGAIEAVSAVHVRGVAMTFAADYASVTLMNAASLSDGTYATCLAAGWIRLKTASGSELGAVTVDVSGDKAGGVFVDTTAGIVRRLFGATSLSDPGDLVASTFTALEAAQPAPVGYGIATGSEETVAQSVGLLMAGIGGWCGARRSGKFEVRRLEAPGTRPSSGVYDKTNARAISSPPLPSNVSPPPWRISVGYDRLWTPGQTDLAGSVSDARRAYLAQEERFAVAEDLGVKADFPPGHEWVKSDTFFRDQADAAAEAARLGALWWPGRTLYEITPTEKLFIHELGEGVTVQWDGRFDLQDGEDGVIVKLSEDDAEGVSMMVLV